VPDWLAIALPALALAVALWSSWTAHAALRISKVQHQQRESERQARARLGLRLEPVGRRTDDTGAIIVNGNLARVNFALAVTNDGDTAAGHAAVTMWVPWPGEVRWSDGTGAELPGSTSPVRSSVTLALPGGDDAETLELSARLDAIPLIGETLFFRATVDVPNGGRSAMPMRAQVRAEKAEETVELDRVFEFVHEAP
jgi:hypothetical protein